MRITGGEKRGFKLKAPRGLRTRPPSEKIRQAVFNILGPAVDGARVLDLFAGSGSFGLEALSRGAASAVFVDSSGAALKLVLETLRYTGMEERGRTVRARAWDFMRSQAARSEPYDLVFLDPPFREAARVVPGADIYELLVDLVLGRLVSAGGKVVLRVPREAEISDRWQGYRLSVVRTYGASKLLVFEPDF